MPPSPNPRPAKPTNARDYDVIVRTRRKDTGYDIWIEGGNDLVFNKNALHMRRGEVHWVRFFIENGEGCALSFPADPLQAIWFDFDRCPEGPTVEMPPGIKRVWSKGGELIVLNKNYSSQTGTFHYRLNLLDPAGKMHDLDPTWGNQNGGEFDTLQYFGLAAGGIAAVAGALYLAKRASGGRLGKRRR
jgi:hypothetical protein